MTETPIEYRTLIGWDHVPKNGDALRFEPGDIVTGVPEKNCRVLAEAGVLEAVAPVAKPKARKRVTKDAA